MGDIIDVTLSNRSDMGHSIDFHAALAPASLAYVTIGPGEILHFSFSAEYPGAFLYHCSTDPVLLHIANGMFGALIVDPVGGWQPADAQNVVLVQNEFYLKALHADFDLFEGDLSKMMNNTPDMVTFDGVSGQFVDKPLHVVAGRPIRIFLIDAGPNDFSAFHVIGSVFQSVYADGNPDNVSVGRQTVLVPPGGSAVINLTLYQPGKYPFVSHARSDAVLGAKGIFVAQ